MSAPLFLIGFMAAGKTSVGRALAQATGRRFVDLDDVVASAGEPVAKLVERDEQEFRRREAKALDDVMAAAPDGPVIATGGGAAAWGTNLDRMREAGCVIALGVDADEAIARAGAASGRPLLARAHELAAQRAPVYRRAHAVVDTNGRTIADVVNNARAVERVWTQYPGATIVALGERSYAVTIEASLEIPAVAGATQRAVITDRNVADAWPSRIPKDALVIEPGEASKSFAMYEKLCGDLIARGLDRNSAIVAVGGGVVGDLAGFVAATLFRGIQVIQVPTTIVAMTDAAIGGKTAIDSVHGKNLVGAFWQPRRVACSLESLATLPVRERRAGFGELWKYGLLDGQQLWDAVDACAAWAAQDELTAPPPQLREVVARSAAYKAAIVGRDEFERTGQRALLNLGHTVGHAIETRSGLHHGEAVGLGLVAACRVSAALGMAPATLEAAVVDALRRSGLPADPSSYLSDDVLDTMRVDKKRVADKVRFIAVRSVGQCEPVELELTELRRILRSHGRP